MIFEKMRQQSPGLLNSFLNRKMWKRESLSIAMAFSGHDVEIPRFGMQGRLEGNCATIMLKSSRMQACWERIGALQ